MGKSFTEPVRKQLELAQQTPPSEIEVSWASGLLDGEGCFSIFRRHGRISPRLETAIHCEMSDLEPVKRLQDIFKLGTICTRANVTGRVDNRPRKVTYIWSVQSRHHVLHILRVLLPYMVSVRRQLKITDIIQSIEEVENETRTI